MSPRRWGCTVALALGLSAVPGVAFADPTPVQLGVEVGPSPLVLRPYTTSQLSFTVANDGTAPATAPKLVVTLPLLAHGITVTHSSITCAFDAGASTVTCSLDALPAGGSQVVALTLETAATDVPEGQSVTGTGTATVSDPDDTDASDNTAPVALTLAVPAPPSATEVRGTVVDALTGAGLAGARITVTDSAGHAYSATTLLRGMFVVRPPAGGLLVPGKVSVSADKPGYLHAGTVVTAMDGQAISGVAIAARRAVVAAAPVPAVSASPSPLAVVASVADTSARDAALSARERARDRTILLIAGGMLGGVILLGMFVWLVASTGHRLRRRAATGVHPTRVDNDLSILLP